MQPTKTTTLLHQTEKFGYFCIINIRKTIQDRNKSKEKCNSQKGLLLGLYLLLFTFNSFGQGELYNAKVSIFSKDCFIPSGPGALYLLPTFAPLGLINE